MKAELGALGAFLRASPPSLQERVVRSSQSIWGIHSCTCIRCWPDTEGFSAPSSLRFLPLVFPSSALNRRFQRSTVPRFSLVLQCIRHSMHYPCGPLSSSLPASSHCPAHRQPGQGCGNTHILIPRKPPPSSPWPSAPGCPQCRSHRLPWHRLKSCHTGLQSCTHSLRVHPGLVGDVPTHCKGLELGEL